MVDVLSSSRVRNLPEREQLALLVQQWNENRLDLFHLSYPTEDLEIEGVMRFYFQDGGERVLTKCVRVSSTATTRAVVDALADKFLPDLKMLTDDSYSLWEVHENCSERKLDDEEKPLLVQLNWHRDDREGRFLLRRDNQPTIPLTMAQQQQQAQENSKGARYSKKDKRDIKKKRDIITLNCGREEPIQTNDIYQQVPQNTFTRTISNPEVVMKKKREKKLEAKLKEIGHGGSLKVYGGELVPSKPYVSILVSIDDTAGKILTEALEKYRFDARPGEYVLVELPVSGSRRSLGDVHSSEGRIINPQERPLQGMHFTENGSDTYLAIRRAPSDYRAPASVISEYAAPLQPAPKQHGDVDPAFLILQPDGSPSDPPQWIDIFPGITEVGSDRSLVQYSPQSQNIYIDSPEICGRHCVITLMDGITTITPSADEARLEVNQKIIKQTEILSNGALIVIGRTNIFQFFNDKNSQHADVGPQSEYSDINHVMGSVSLSGVPTESRKLSDQFKSQSLPISGMGHMTLPISLQIGDYKVWDYLVEVMSRGYADSAAFRLSPAYALYLALRFFHSHSKPYLVQFFTRISHHMNQISQECTSRDELIFWLANASELSYIVERNPDLRTPRSGQLGSVVEGVFRRLCTVLLGAVRPACQPMLDLWISTEDATAELIALLDSTLRTARASRLNPALTIQLCSQMFHTINATVFNSMVGAGTTQVGLNTRLGKCLVHRLTALHRWAEQMGVELAAECHLDRCRQAANLLASQKNDITTLGTTCYKLNSIQVRYLLSHFVVENGEIPCDGDILSRVVSLSERQADVLTQQDGLPLALEETDQLSLPFLLPQDGYTAEHLKTVPDGLAQYLYGLQDKGLCHSVNLNDQMPGSTDQSQPQRFADHNQGILPTSAIPPVPMQRSASQSTLTSIPTHFGDSFGSTTEEIVRVVLKRGSGGIGLSIVAAQGIGDRQTGIYIKKVVEGSPASLDGRLAPGDQLLSVNGQSLLGITQEDAAQCMARSGSEVYFEVKKGAANKNGLAVWLNSNAPVGQLNAPISNSTTNIVPPSPAMSQSLHSQASNRPNQMPPGPPPYSNYSNLPKYGSQQSVQQTPTYTQRHQQINASRGSAFQPPNTNTSEPLRHVRSISASELYQNDPNASYSQRSIASTTTGFDKLPAHYRHSSRPTVVQPGRPCPSPTSLRKGAQSPVSLYRPPSTTGLQRPPSVTNLFAPPRSPNPLQQQGYSSGVRESTQDIYRAGNHSSPPQAQSSPVHNYNASNYSATLPNSYRSNMDNYSNLPQSGISTTRISMNNTPTHVPRATVVPNNGYSQHYQEPVVIRPHQVSNSVRETIDNKFMKEEVRTTIPVKGAVPTAITKALALQAASSGGVPSRVANFNNASRLSTGIDREVRDLERNAFLSREALEDELDRLDAKGVDMKDEEKLRYRQLLNMTTEMRKRREEQPLRPVYPTADPVPAQITVHRRTETLIDEPSSGPNSARENISPHEQNVEKKNVQFKEDYNFLDGKEDVLDSPGIVGNNEIYRDPRQRRLNELQERQELRGPDGSRLDFRDKMKLFAHQIGEGTPKPKYHSSSAERQIQQD